MTGLNTDELPTEAVHVRLYDDQTPSPTPTSSTVKTVFKWQTLPSNFQSPRRSFDPLKDDSERCSIRMNENPYLQNFPLVVRFEEEQIRCNEAEASKKEKRMDDALFDSGPPTPDTDDTPYIRFALDQLTRDEEIMTAQRPNSDRSCESYTAERIVPNHFLYEHVQPGSIHTREELALARKHRSSPGPDSTPRRLFRYNATRPLSYDSADIEGPVNPDIFIPVEPPQDSSRFPDLMFLPTILRPLPMMKIALLCLLMIAAITFSAIYSTYHNGLVDWVNGLYGARYFIFRFLPQVLAAVLWMLIQEVLRASRRILPYTFMAMEDANWRAHGLFLDLHQKSFLLPRWDGQMSLNIANFSLWLSVLTIPLQSCLFSVIHTDENWRWAAVQGVAWTLVAAYILVLIGVAMTALFFHRRNTGLMWDPRSLADIISLLPRSNSLNDYTGTGLMRDRNEIQDRLRFRSDRLGYWRTLKRTQEIFYCIGEEGASTRRYTLDGGKIQERSAYSNVYRSSDMEKAVLFNEQKQFGHIPWFLRDTFVIFWSMAAFILLLALVIVSFLPSTAIRKGFAPQLETIANAQGFSTANFLYSFVPAMLGLLLYLFFQPLDMSLRQLQPWAELARQGGSDGERSLLSDYTARSPLDCAWNALQAGHYRVAIISLLSFLFILIPVLAGGLFFALTTPSNEVRMIPNLAAFYILLVTLFFYLFALLILIPNRRLLHLPHAVDCLAEIFSFLHNSQMLDDSAFRAPRTPEDLKMRLISVRDGCREARYEFGVHQGRNGREWTGIERTGRDGYRKQAFF